MPTVPEMASAFRSRLRVQEPSDSDHVRSSPATALSKSRSKENLFEFSEKERGDQVVSGVQSFELQEDPSFWKDHNVQVVIRIRPLSSSEISLQGHNKCVKQDSCQSITWTGHPESRFTFDHVADENVNQEKLFKVAGLPMVENCVGGYNSCMFAYGQTGSGKTHTMLGDIEGGTRRHSVNCGMTPRVFEHLFSRIQKEKESRRDEKLRFTCKCSFLEIYNEQILDLLNPSQINLQIREDAKKGVYVENLTELEVSSCRDVIQQLVQGAANRKVAATNMNRASSRSHSVFTCIIESQWESQGVTHHRFARLNLVDLAGSERQKSSGAEGERLKEATNINKSLSTLGLVIMNLVSICNGKSLHVPYRDSKLTFLLQDSLGGNSKTIIIANISPSSCCALETLSTLKFAQRAKFIRNNAIINEDASGDVLTMRLHIQQLKKEVNRLRGLVNGGTENQENDNLSVCFPGSPGSFKWDGVQASLSPLTTGKRLSHKKEYEVALVGAFRREQDKEIALQALAAENQAAMQLAKQREEEIQGLKMRLRFREAGIKRLEAVASGKISAEAHLLQEKEELLKEIEVLRNQVDRNQEVTRFAMENLRLKEEIRRLQSFYEDGEQEMMNEQITILQNKLLEALDWKLMHEKDPEIDQKGNLDLGTPVRCENNLLTSSQDPSSAWDSSSFINEENEFLHMQAIQNQREVEALRKNLNFCLEAKEKLERRVDDLVSQLEEERESASTMKEAVPVPSREDEPSDDAASNKQIELQTLVDAISAASQREAEAHETAIMLSKENEELRMKLKVLIEDNNKLIELYESAVSEGNTKVESVDFTENDPENFDLGNCNSEVKDVGHWEHQLQEMHEENDKLLSLYEKAMQERDEFKRILCIREQNNTEVREEFQCPERLVEVDGEANSGSRNLYIYEMDETENLRSTCSEDEQRRTEIEEPKIICEFETRHGELSEGETNFARTQLEMVQLKLEKAARAVSFFGLLEKSTVDAGKLSEQIEASEISVLAKEQEIGALKLLCSEKKARITIVDKKLLAIKSALSTFYSSINYWEHQETKARMRVDTASQFLKKKKDELAGLRIHKEEIETSNSKAQQSKIEFRSHVDSIKSRIQDLENQRKETEKVLTVIDNLDKREASTQKNLHFGKAFELLKSEEERAMLFSDLKQSREKMAVVLKEIENLGWKRSALETEIERVDAEIMTGLRSMEEAENGLQNVVREKKSLVGMREEGQREVENMILEYQQCVFESYTKEEEIKIYEEELCMEMRNLEDLRERRMQVTQRKKRLLEDEKYNFSTISELDEELWCVSEKVEAELYDVQRSVLEAKSLLATNER